ncbi:MAG: hypothetical protein FMNOHCHN_02083 [Ignavibacteriaceae bacterium]|nr:hypothetical protein [Ignavibacteriaceae bacterium]
MSIRVRDIFIYPVKGLDPHRLDSAEITPGGSLKYDRMFAMKDEQGKYINGKKNDRIYLLRSSFSPEKMSITFSGRDIQQETFQLTENMHLIQEFLSGYFQKNVTFLRNEVSGFPDDTDASGPTVALRESIQEVCRWFPDISADEMTRRFRPNIILEGAEPFWEDRLLPEHEPRREFRIGDVAIHGINPCARCAVPTRHPETGDIYPLFQKAFAEKRKASLPEWAPEKHFDHYYRFTVNTRIPSPEAGKYIQTGDEAILPANALY